MAEGGNADPKGVLGDDRNKYALNGLSTIRELFEMTWKQGYQSVRCSNLPRKRHGVLILLTLRTGFQLPEGRRRGERAVAVSMPQPRVGGRR